MTSYGRALALVLLSLLLIAPARAQTSASSDAASYPNRPIRIIVPFPAGGPSDVLARIIGQRLSEDWKQPVLIENRVGANTVIGAQIVATAPGDGYTLLMAIELDAGHEPVPLQNPALRSDPGLRADHRRRQDHDAADGQCRKRHQDGR